MSLDVYLNLENTQSESGSGIFVREDGGIKEITRAEWDEKFPDREPWMVTTHDDTEVYWANITHNLNKMAQEAGIYQHLWRPDELGIEFAHELVEPLRDGLLLLKSDRERFEEFNPSNGWGDYDALVGFVEKYLAACEKYPHSRVMVSR